jgi:two-component system, chemotaxis family, chemotaxis protein CheY
MKKILIVDDSETLRIQLKKDLEQAQYLVVEASDGVHGMEILDANRDTSLIICDINMPRMDGISMCSKIKEKPEFKSLPILMMTTESSAELKAKGKEIGVLAWITKPYSAEKLIGVLGKILK